MSRRSYRRLTTRLPIAVQSVTGGQPRNTESRDAKLWLDGSRLEKAAGYNRGQLTQIGRIVEAHADEFKARWHDYFD